MAEQKISLYQDQKKAKPLIEDMIPNWFDGEMKNHATDFVTRLRVKKLNPTWFLANQWKIASKGKMLCRISLNTFWCPKKEDTKWVVTTYLQNLKEYEDVIINEDLQHLLWNNVLYCAYKPLDSLPAEEARSYPGQAPCNNHGNCNPGKNITVCNKELTNICCNDNRQFFWIRNPDQSALDGIIKLLELEKAARNNNARISKEKNHV